MLQMTFKIAEFSPFSQCIDGCVNTSIILLLFTKGVPLKGNVV